MNSLLIEDVTIITMDAERRVIRNGAIVADSGIITFVGPSSDLPQGLPEVPRICGRGQVATPGLVNAHTHSAMVLFRGYADDLPLQEWLETKIFPVEARLTRDDVYWGAMLACAEMIRSGTTAFADMYFHMDEAARAVEASGMRASLSEGMTSASGRGDDALARGAGFCERWHGAAGGRITTMLAPHAPYTCSRQFMGAVAARAEALGVGVHTHISETFREVRDIKLLHGMSPVEFVEASGLLDVQVLAAHCVAVSDRDMDILAQHGVKVAHNPGSNMKLASGTAPIAKMLKRHMDVGLGTDGAASNNNLDMVEEMRLAALLHKVASAESTAMPALTCLEMATRGGAACIGLSDYIGSIEVGKKADIVLFDFAVPHLTPSCVADPLSHIVYSAEGSDVTTVIIDGALVMENRRLTTIDEREVMAEVEKRTYRLASV
ncbi:MAG: amidohydrolase [Clostridia bacterium]|nr:amidohydrolase [Clostridia bacterium]